MLVGLDIGTSGARAVALNESGEVVAEAAQGLPPPQPAAGMDGAEPRGLVAGVWAPGGKPRVVFSFTITGEKIVAIDLLADPELLSRLDLAILDA